MESRNVQSKQNNLKQGNIKSIRHVSRMIRVTYRMLHQLLQFINLEQNYSSVHQVGQYKYMKAKAGAEH